jgi:hypothetical protein
MYHEKKKENVRERERERERERREIVLEEYVRS